MQLITLTCNQPGFHAVNFKSGLNFIIGERTNPTVKDPKDSYNGVGKSLVVELIHFCLGSTKNKVFAEKLSGYEFTLKFRVGLSEHTIVRGCNDDQTPVLDNKKYNKLTDFTKELEKLVFPTLPNVSGLSFRSLISRFIRRHKKNYTSYNGFVTNEQPYNQLLNNSYLLGLEISIAEMKMKIKESSAVLTSAKKSLHSDKLLLEYFKGIKDIKFQIAELKEKKTILEKRLNDFKVAENYTEIQVKANELSTLKKKLINDKYFVEHNLDKARMSSDKNITLSVNDIQKMYLEAKQVMPEVVIREALEVEEFHKNLVINRHNTLARQIVKYETDLKALNSEINATTIELDRLMKYLKDHGALEEYIALSNSYSKTLEQLNKFNDYNKLIDDYEVELSKKKKENEDNKIAIKKYLGETTPQQDRLMSKFKSFSKQFYENKTSGLSINGNYKNNKVAWDIHADIEGDSSDGINEVLIFCYDMTVFTVGNHSVKFLFHDSRLFSNMDPRQVYTAIRLAQELTKDESVQYISSWNEDMLISIKDMVSEQDFDNLMALVKKNTVLTLQDDKDENKLLGVKLDIPYDK